MNSIKVMLVDDEDIVIEDLKTLIDWEKYGFKIVATATNGKKALELYKLYQPQIVIADIKMPGMDGLGLSTEIMSIDRSVKILLLTAYKDFEYAKNAVSIGVSNYLIKHEIDDKSLMFEITKLKNEIEKEKIKTHIVRQQFFKKIIEEGLISSEIMNETVFIDHTEKFALLLLKYDSAFPIIPNNILPCSVSFSERLKGCDIEKPEFVNYFEVIDVADKYGVIIFSINKTNSQRKITEELYLFASSIQKYVKSSFKITVSMAIKSMTTSVEGLRELYSRAAKNLDNSIFNGREKIYIHNYYYQGPDNFEILNDKIKMIKDAISKNDYNSAITDIKNIFSMLNTEIRDVKQLKKVCNELVNCINSKTQLYGIISLEQRCVLNQTWVDSWFEINDICQWFEEIIKKICEEIEHSVVGNVSNKIKNVIIYIENHYSEDITLERVAEVFELSRVYLGQVIKKETGHTFLEYLTNCRVEAAKRMLLNDNYKIYEIAEKTGYKTSQYFSEVFRKATGINPLDFRNGGDK